MIQKNYYLITNTHLAQNNQQYCQHCRRIRNPVDKRSHTQSNEHENNRKGTVMYSNRTKNPNTESSHIQSKTLVDIVSYF